MSAQLVAYSGFSAANYLREPFSSDLDFGIGEWSASAWVNVPATLPVESFPAIGSEVLAPINFTSGWTSAGLVGSFTQNIVATTGIGGLVKVAVTAGKTYSISADITVTGTTIRVVNANAINGTNILNPAAESGTGSYSATFIAATTYIYFRLSGAGTLTVNSVSIKEIGPTLLVDRAHSSGPKVSIGVTTAGFLTATAYDGTTTRTVTTTAAYNTATWLKARVNYTIDGKLAILVNGVEVAATTGTPLLTLNNSNAVLTIGNSYALDAPFPGSIALLKFSATVPTAEQSAFAYEQEKQLFREGAQCVLPASTSILDLAYDDATDTWSALQATQESTWSGLVRTSTQAPSAGSFSKVSATSGIKLLGRTTTNPGVDVQIPSKNLRPKDIPVDRNQDITVFDYLGGFTATTTLNSTSLTSVASSLTPTNLIGCVISGTGIPANTVITGVSGSTIYMSAAATANGSSIQISTTDFNLPVGLEAKAVMVSGTLKREGSTSDYTRRFDGFRETIRFGTAPGYNAWVQIQAVRSIP